MIKGITADIKTTRMNKAIMQREKEMQVRIHFPILSYSMST